MEEGIIKQLADELTARITSGIKEKEMQEFLTPEELTLLTGKVKNPQRISWLRDHDWIFVENAKGFPVVSRLYCRQKLGVTASKEPSKPPQWEPNFAALLEDQNAGHKSKTRKS